MWRALMRKGRADIVSRPLQNILLFVVISVGAATLTLSLTIGGAQSQSVESWVEESNAAHIWYSTDTDTDTLDSIAERAFVAEYSGVQPALNGGTLLTGATPRDLTFSGVDPEATTITFGIVRAGRWPAEGAAGTAILEAALDPGLARELDLGLGDTISVATRGGVFELDVVGLIVPTSRVPYPVWSTAAVFVTSDALDTLGGGRPGHWVAGYRLDDPHRVDTFMQAVAISLRGAPGGHSWLTIRDDLQEENQGATLLLGTFAIFTLFAAALIIANSVTGQVQAQLRDVGLLKSIGATPRQVATLLAAEVGVIAAVAAAIGIAGGRFLTPVFLDEIDELLGSSASGSLSPFVVAGVFVGVLAVALVATLIPAVRAGRTSTAAALAGALNVGGGVSGLARFAVAMRVPRVVAFGLKDPFTRRTRA